MLLRSIPSVTIDKSGTVSIRGGFAFEAAYEFEGIDYTTPTANLQNTLQNVANFGLLNGVGSVQLIPGGGDATHGNTGTGLVLFTAKHGTFPSYLPRRRRSADVSVPAPARTGMGLGRSDRSASPTTPDSSDSSRAFSTARPEPPPTRWARWAPTQRRWAARSIQTSSTTRRRSCRPAISSTTLIYRFGKNNSQRLQFFIQDPDDHANARLRRLSVSAVYLRRYARRAVRAVSGHRA